MALLALGISGGAFVAFWNVTRSYGGAIAASAGALALCYGMWFAFTTHRRRSAAKTRIL